MLVATSRKGSIRPTPPPVKDTLVATMRSTSAKASVTSAKEPRSP